MDKLIAAGRLYAREMELEDVAMLKLCVLGFGVLLGIATPKGMRRFSAFLAAMVFVGTLVPVMTRFFAALVRKD